MANFKKSDLKLTHYSGTATGDDDPKLTGSPDSDLFNREEVYEVVYMLNKVLETLGSDKKSDLHKLEYMVKDDLPGNIRSQEKVHAWLVANF